MSKSAIYTINTTSGTSLTSGATYTPDSVVRRFGGNCQMVNNGIVIDGAGYYSVDATVTVVATAAGTVTASLYQNGQPIAGATATVQAAAVGDIVTLPITALVRLNCNCSDTTLTVVMGTAATSQNLAFKVERI